MRTVLGKRAEVHVAILDDRKQPLPALVHQLVQEVQAVPQAREAVLPGERFRQPGGHQKIFGGSGKSLLGSPHDARPVGALRLGGPHGIIRREIVGVFLLARLFQLGACFKRDGSPRRIIARNRGKQTRKIQKRLGGHDDPL